MKKVMLSDDFVKRAVSGFSFVIIVLAGIYSHWISLWVMLMAIEVLGTLEFARMAGRMGARLNWRMCMLTGGILITAAFLHTQFRMGQGYLFVIPAILIFAVAELYRLKGNAFMNLAFGMFAIIYLAVPLSLLLYLPQIHMGLWQEDFIFMPFLLVWFNDTFAYITGVLFGKHKLFPRISPKKTWEGVIGGGLLTIASAILLAPTFEQTSALQMGMFALVAVVAGTFGDLLESILKRCSKVKDTGTLMPGHGGVLDRMDSVLVVIPALFFYIKVVKLF